MNVDIVIDISELKLNRTMKLVTAFVMMLVVAANMLMRVIAARLLVIAAKEYRLKEVDCTCRCSS